MQHTEKYYITKSLRNKNHFEVSCNFNILLFFTPRCRRGITDPAVIRPITVKGKQIYNVMLTRNDLKEFKEMYFEFTEVKNFNDLLN